MNEKNNNYIDFNESSQIKDKPKFGIGLDDNHGAFLIGCNINIQKDIYYICIYLGFKTLVIGKEYFE